MNFFDSVLMAVRSIFANRLRSALTMLGVVIGIASVIILVAIGEAAKVYVVAQVESWGIGPNVIQINPGKDQMDVSAMMNSKLRVSDALQIKEKSPSIDETLPIIMGGAKARYGKKEHSVSQVWGVTDNYQKIFNHKLTSGKFFVKGDVDGRRSVCVLGKTVARKLFGNFDPIGERIKLTGRKFVVLGVFEEKGKMLNFDMDDIVVIPITSAMSLFDTKGVVEIDVAAKSRELVPKAVQEIHAVLGRRLSKDDYQVTTQEGMMNMLNNIVGLLTSVIGGIAAISLIVGSIGIMNIMLVSVTERTKEIGIRKAVGARKIDVFSQFLIESVVISFFGGLLGIVLGLAGTFLIMYVIKLEMVVVVWALTLAVTVSAFIGVISGVYPAMRAVNLDPIEALRYE